MNSDRLFYYKLDYTIKFGQIKQEGRVAEWYKAWTDCEWGHGQIASEKSGVGSNPGAGGDKGWSCQEYEEMGNCAWSFSFSMKLFWILQHHKKITFFNNTPS